MTAKQKYESPGKFLHTWVEKSTIDHMKVEAAKMAIPMNELVNEILSKWTPERKRR